MNSRFSKTRIICTLGPSSSSVENIVKMINAGMDCARLNFSHSSHAEHKKMINAVRKASKITKEPIAIIQDLQGPKIRTGKLKEAKVFLIPGNIFTITIDDILGDAKRVSTTYKKLPHDVKVGDVILINDGLIKLIVKSKTKRDVVTEIIFGGELSNNKGINLPEINISSPSCTEKDLKDLSFGVANGVDYVALSFVRNANDIKFLRKQIIKRIEKTRRLPIIAKIEKQEALKNIDEIIAEADAIMIARGDLGVECELEDVPMLQKMICEKAFKYGKPVIIATQMLESMIENPRPTRAEANDVANAVLDGADAVMLSGETSVGKHVPEVVRIMDSIVRRAEENSKDRVFEFASNLDSDFSTIESIGQAACVLAKQVGAKVIVPITHSGATAQIISRYRPTARIIAATSRIRIQCRLNLFWGIRSILVPPLTDSDSSFPIICKLLLKNKYLVKGDKIVVTAGLPLHGRGKTNMLKVQEVE
ncbi:MAG: pyruvate kinase [Bacteroidota bacterium]